MQKARVQQVHLLQKQPKIKMCLLSTNVKYTKTQQNLSPK